MNENMNNLNEKVPWTTIRKVLKSIQKQKSVLLFSLKQKTKFQVLFYIFKTALSSRKFLKSFQYLNFPKELFFFSFVLKPPDSVFISNLSN